MAGLALVSALAKERAKIVRLEAQLRDVTAERDRYEEALTRIGRYVEPGYHPFYRDVAQIAIAALEPTEDHGQTET